VAWEGCGEDTRIQSRKNCSYVGAEDGCGFTECAGSRVPVARANAAAAAASSGGNIGGPWRSNWSLLASLAGTCTLLSSPTNWFPKGSFMRKYRRHESRSGLAKSQLAMNWPRVALGRSCPAVPPTQRRSH
jgi:hypothetical protein